MKKRLSCFTMFGAALALLVLLSVPALHARDIAPIVSTEWLEKNLGTPKLVVLDIRKVEDFKAGHIPSAVNVFYGSWAIMKGGLRNELPPADDLFDVIGSAGIGPDSRVVIVGMTDSMPNRTDITRVAWTLKYAGIQNIALLDGGFNQWTAEKRKVSSEAAKPAAKDYRGTINASLFVNKDYVMKALGRAILLDNREPDFFNGLKKMDFVAKAGRIKGAVNLPPSQAYKADGAFKEKAELAAAAAAVAGTDPAREIIVYCDTGKVCTSWAFVLTEVLDYKNVKVYDGSSEDWMKDPAAPIEP